MSNRTAYTAIRCPFFLFYANLSSAIRSELSSSTDSTDRSVTAVGLRISNRWYFGQPIGEFLSRRAGTLFFYSLSASDGHKTGPSIRPLNHIPRPFVASEPLSGSQTSIDLILVSQINGQDRLKHLPADFPGRALVRMGVAMLDQKTVHELK